MNRNVLPLLVCAILISTPLFMPLSESSKNDKDVQGWWSNYSRDKDRDGISDVLEWKLQQGNRFFDSDSARVFIRYNHHPTDSDIEKLENLGIEVTYRAQYIDLVATTMPRNLVYLVSTWNGVVMLDDIGKAVPHMNEAVPAMGVNQVWENYGIYGEGISIAIVDTGVDNAHVGLDDMDDNQFTMDDLKVVAYYDAVQDNVVCSPCLPGESLDSGTHGTHVAGIAAGTGDGDAAPDGSRHIGVAPKASLVNVLSCCDGDIEDIIRGVEWTITNQKLVEPNIRVMTSSLGEQQIEFHIDNDGSSAWSQVVDAAVESGLVVTLSAGNEFGSATAAGCNTIDSPGDSRLPITVASLDKDLSLAIYSSRGYTSDGRVKPDVAAIGSSIMAPNKGTGTGYTSKSGTSMATPLMAGIVALTLEANPDLTPTEVKDTLVAGYSIEREILDDDIDAASNNCSIAETRPDNEYGYGQADPKTFVDISGNIDASLSINWSLEPEYMLVNDSYVEVKPRIYNGSWIRGVSDSSGQSVSIGVEVRFGVDSWSLADDLSDNSDWSEWQIQVPEQTKKGNQTLYARLVVNSEQMSPMASASVVLLNEYDTDDIGSISSLSDSTILLLTVLLLALTVGVGIPVWKRYQKLVNSSTENQKQNVNHLLLFRSLTDAAQIALLYWTAMRFFLRDEGASQSLVSAYYGIALLVLGVSLIFWGHIADTYGSRRKILLYTSLGCTILYLFIPFLGIYGTIFISILLLMLHGSGRIPRAIASEYYPNRQGEFNGVFWGMFALIYSVAYLAAPSIYESLGMNAIVLFCLLLNIAAAFCAFRLNEVDIMAGTLVTDSSNHLNFNVNSFSLDSLRFKNSWVKWILLTVFLIYIPRGVIVYNAPNYFDDIGYDRSFVGVIMGYSVIASVILYPWLGSICDRLGAWQVLLWSALLYILLWGTFSSAVSTHLSAFIFIIPVIPFLRTSRDTLMSQLTALDERSKGMGWGVFVGTLGYSVGAFFASAMLGWLDAKDMEIQMQYLYTFRASLVFLLLASVVAWWLNKNTTKEATVW